MKLSRKFVSDYIDIDPKLTIKDIAEDMTNVGNEYDSAEKLINCTNLVIGQVIKCCMHPDSDHLHVCKVDIGSEVLDIVCGAPNVREGIKVIVAKVGAKLPGGDIKKSTIRGCVSNGMLCSIKELGLEHKFLSEADINGIHELPEDASLGEDPIKYLELDDEVIDFELTSNRGDLLSILGMAYELGAIYKKKVKDIDLEYSEDNNDINDSFNVKVETKDCSVFLAKKAMNVVIKESPTFIKNRLIASGIRPINNVVDISNYVMLETGQPLHFYDADRLGDTLIVRNALDNETLTTLDNIERTLSKEDIVIASKSGAIGLAGVMGGLSTEVENDTKNIIIESAIFDGVKVRRTSKKIVRSEASTRFEKGLDPKRTYMAIKRSCALLERYADASIAHGMVEFNESNVTDKVIELPIIKIEKVLGIKIPLNESIDILKSLGFDVNIDGDKLIVKVPSRRLDVNIPEDLIEEIGRLYGIDRIIGKLPTTTGVIGKYNKVKRDIRNKMISLGLNETLSYTLIKSSDVHKYTTDNFIEVKLQDPMSEDRSTLRYSLISSLKDIYDYNKNRGYKDISIFEIGKGFFKKDNIYQEELKLAVLLSGVYTLGLDKKQVDFYILKGIVEELLNYLGYKNRYSFVVDDNIPKELHPGVSASIVVQGEHIGILGKLMPNISKDDIYVMEINLDKLLKFRGTKMSFKVITKYPSIKKDVAFIVDKSISAGSIEAQIKKSGGKLLSNIEVFDVYMGDNLKDNEKSLAFNLTFQDSNRTLEEDEVMIIFNKIISDVEKNCHATLRNM